jgi:DNA primase
MLPRLDELGLTRLHSGGRRDFFSNRLLFPIADESGRWIGFGARRLDEADQPKFLNSRDLPGIFEKKRVLYGLDRARAAPAGAGRTRQLVIVEGYLDVVIAHQAGIRNVVAALSAGFTKEHCALAKRFADGVVLLFDGDAAGQAANRRVLEGLLDLDLDARVATLPEKTDPDEYVLREGKEAFEKLTGPLARDVFQHLVDLAAGGAGGAQSGGAGAAHVTPAMVAECARLLGKFKDDIRHQLSLRFVAERLRIPEELLRREALKVGEANRRAPAAQGAGSLRGLPEPPRVAPGDPLELALSEPDAERAVLSAMLASIFT